ncbi:MAG: phosphoribosylglycinamide formyltransferase [Planctomycetes bacterium SM23_32]|nr:MAG: phosphoribosylglycinamide formyltransferase [Planctomycetes bacterium SM23_32]
MASKVRLGVLISGGGRTLQNFLDLADQGRLKAEVVKVVSSRQGAYGLERARQHGVPAAVVVRKGSGSLQEFSEAVTAELQAEEVELVAMAGFLCLYRIPDPYMGRVMNIHPALLPSFGGKGFYGDRVHEAVLDYGCKVTGCTVHFADNVYDHGPVIVQKAVPVQEGDDAHSLAARVFEAEKVAYPEAVNLFAEGRLHIAGRRVQVSGTD